jgi:hypothetical protein
MAGPERSIEKSFVDWCMKAHGLTVRKLREEKRNGFPDRSIILPGGRLVCIEFKAPNGRLRPAQAIRIPELMADGVPVLVTSDLKEAKSWLTNQMK